MRDIDKIQISPRLLHTKSYPNALNIQKYLITYHICMIANAIKACGILTNIS